MKNLLGILFIFSLLFSYSYADDNETLNNICSGEQIEELQYISNVATNTSYTQIGTLDENSAPADNIDYYYFTPSLSGDITFEFTADQRINLDISIINCNSSDVESYGNTAADGPDTFSISSTDTIYIKVERVKSGLTTYSLDLDFSPASKTYGCSNPKQFSLRKSTILPGDLIAIGNSNICADTAAPYGECDPDQTQRNDRTEIIFINSTSSSDINASDTSENTSSAQLSLPAGATVVWAGLYWQAEIWDIQTDAGWLKKERAATVKFKTPSGTYQDIQADEHHYIFVQRNTSCTGCDFNGVNRYEEHYQAFKDVTSLVTGDGNYSVANIQATVGKLDYPGVEAAWSLQIIYEYPDANPRSIAINDGYVALYSSAGDGEDYANEINGLYGTSCATDANSTGVFAREIEFPVTGFLTPKLPGFDVDMSIFITESDPDGGSLTENLTISKKDGSTTLIDGTDAWNYEITNKDGSNNLNRVPAYIYPIGMTIKNYTRTDALDTEQSSTNVKFETDGDRLLLGVVGFATDLRKPVLCYDYSYKQFDQFFTEENNGTQYPHIYSPSLTAGEPIDVGLYIQNKEASDIIAENLVVSILDINSTQATYIPESTRFTEPGTVIQTSVSDSDLNVSDSYIRGMDKVAELTSLEYFYTYFALDPSLSSIDIPLNARVDYNVTLPTDSGTITIPYSLNLNSDIELCTSAYNSYTPNYGTFSVAHKYELDNGGYDNIPTQVARKADDFVIVGYNPSSPQAELNRRTTVAIELIDIGGYQSSFVACDDPGSSISPRVWFSTDGNVSRIDVTKEMLDEAIAAGRSSDALSANPIASAEDFFSVARTNAAFRISYSLADGNGSLIELSDPIVSGGVTSYNVLNFTELININGGVCLVDVDGNPGNIDTIAQTCSNAGKAAASAMTEAELAVCMECVYGYNVNYDCSRDNFAIRPEAFKILIADNGQSTSPAATTLPIPTVANIAAGYNYRYDINATSHADDRSVTGYTRSYALPGPDYNITAYWRPNGHVVSGCNDINNLNPEFFMVNGSIIEYNTTSPNVGRYELEMRDNTWTEVDQAPGHHATGNYRAGNDCNINSTSVPDYNATGAGVHNYNTVGCNISSEHTNTEISTTYSDYEITVHPYDFNVSTVVFNKDINNAVIPANSADYIYMNSVNDDTSMAVRYTGQIRAIGADNVNVSNFVADCYAEDINLSISTGILPATPLLSYRLQERNISSIIINDTNGTFTPGNTLHSAQILAANFTKGYNGTSDMQLSYNVDRTVNNAINPVTIAYGDFNLTCTTPGNCQSTADMTTTHLPNGGIDSNASITHIYGRLHSPRQRVANPNPVADANAQIPLYYEFYCDNTCNISDFTTAPALSPLGRLSPDDVRWYRQDLHNIVRDGNASATQARTVDDNTLITTKTIDAGAQSASYIYNGNRGYPYKATIELSAPDWLLYNRFNAAATVNDFELEFFSTGSFAGQDQSGVNMDANTSINVNRRISW